MQRLRGAKARKTNYDWWLTSLEKSKSESRSLRLLLIEAFLLLCPTNTLGRCETRLAEILEAMSEEEWTNLVQMVTTIGVTMRGPANKEDSTAPSSLRLDSMRFSYFLALKDPDSFGRPVFLRFFRAYSGTARGYLEFKQTQAVACAIAGLLEWSEALAIIRECYAHDVYAPGIEYQFRHTSVVIPSEIYSEILLDSQKYPVSLCDAAEANASRTARKAVKPVAVVAKADRWFAFDR